MRTTETEHPFNVVIAGGGIAALEGALALRALAEDRVSTTLLAPEPTFVYRPMRVREPFGYSTAREYPLDEITRDIGVELVQDAFNWLDGDSRTVHTAGGRTLHYDALLLATGAQFRPRFRHALTLDDSRLDEQLRGLIEDIEGGHVNKLAFLIPSPPPWPLPIYELALMTARRAYDMNIEMSITIVTPEDDPLSVFGATVSAEVRRLLERHDILTISSAYAETPGPGEVALHPGTRTLYVDRIVALPQLFGPSTPGVPKGPPDGFIAIDSHCRVPGLEDVFAAGDATAFQLKFGGIAAQQADTAAEAIAALAGAEIEPKPFHPTVNAVLLGGDQPLYLSAHITGGHGSSSHVSTEPPAPLSPKIDAKYLAPYLAERDELAKTRT